MSVAHLAAAYREGKRSPLEVCERALDAASATERMAPAMRFFVALDAEDVRAQARESSARIARGDARGPLEGVPVAIKDEFDVRGYRSTHGSAFLGAEPATHDTLVVARLREAGAVLFGKTNMHEFGAGPSGVNPHHGTARNPHDPARDTGGSSSGSAAAVAAGIVPLALGTDSGGSLRVPASLCGIASIKPSFGRVPTTGASLRAWSLEHFGPLGATVADVAAGLSVLTGESFALPADGGIAGLRLGVCDAWWSLASEHVARAAKQSLADLVALGARVVPVSLPHLELAPTVIAATFGVEGAASLERELARGVKLGPSARLAFELGRGMSAVSFVRSQRARTLIARDFDAALEGVDALVTPTTAVTAQRYSAAALGAGELDEAAIERLVCFTQPLNLTGHPAASVPCGHDPEGMPIGFQVITARGRDLLALSIAAEVERRHVPARPKIWFDLLSP